jgi:hypothetical protein
LDGLLSAEEEQYFRAQKLVSAVHAMPGFSLLPASLPSPFMYT